MKRLKTPEAFVGKPPESFQQKRVIVNQPSNQLHGQEQGQNQSNQEIR